MTKKTGVSNTKTAVPDIKTVKARMKATWEDGDYASFATYMEAGAEEILQSWKIAPGQRLLDVGCGAGQSALPAARLGLKVTGVDIAENLIEHANNRAKSEGVEAHFEVGDAEDLPFEEDSFDVVITMIGAMFAPRPDCVVDEMARVLRPGGELLMANWTPHGMPAQMFKCVAGYVPPPPGAIPPVLWGDEATVTERLGEHFSDIHMTRKNYPQWHYPFNAAELVEFFRAHFGPVKRAFESINSESHENLFRELEEIYTNTSEIDEHGITIVEGEYLNIVATRI
jgi:ubiquinone/menaquinone biosynthesis C-methylase UbiE